MRSSWAIAQRLDALLASVAEKVRPLPSLATPDAAEQRARLSAQLERGELPVPAARPQARPTESGAFRVIDAARRLAEESALGPLYAGRLDELELDLAILTAWGDPMRVRPLSARRYGTGEERVKTVRGELDLGSLARAILQNLSRQPAEPRVLPPLAAHEGAAQAPRADRSEPGSVAQLILWAAHGIGLDPSVRVEPRLSSLAATGERTVFLSSRMFTLHEARRLVAHEVFGHLVVAANARAQPLRLLQIGLGGSFADQEGVSLYLEAALGLMENERLRTLAARVLATQGLHAGASFGETARRLYLDFGLSAEASIMTTERAYRGGGAARDAGYLAGFLRVRAAIASGEASLDELRRGRVSLEYLPLLRELAGEQYVDSLGPAREQYVDARGPAREQYEAGEQRLVCAPRYRPSLALSRALTFGGTSADTSPPSEAASLTMFELT